MAEFVPGQSSVYIKFGSTVLSNDYRAFDPEESNTLIDTTAGVDAARSYINSFRDGKASITLLGQTGGTALWAAVAPGTSGTFEWAPEGTASGKQRHYCTAIVMRRKRNNPYDNLEVLDVDWNFTSAVTDTVY